MKTLIIGLALLIAALAAPLVEEADLPYNEADYDTTLLSANFTAGTFHRAVGWAGIGSGTTGGEGGQEIVVWDAFALRSALENQNRRIVTVRGRISLDPLFSTSPGVRIRVGSYTTLRGGDQNALITGGGLRVLNVRQVIISNLRIFNALSYAPGERPNGNGGITNLGNQYFSEVDSIEVSASTNVWIDHCEFSDSPWDSNSSPRRHDGMIDIVRGSDLITVSNNLFSNHNPVSLVGNGDNNAAVDDNRLRTTFFANWFRGTGQRHPRVRFGRVHVLNNLYTDIGHYGVGVGVGARIVVERNVFRNCHQAWGYPAGVPNPVGFLQDVVNIFVNSGFENGIPSNVGWDPFTTYHHRAIPIGEVENHVRRHAGTL